MRIRRLAHAIRAGIIKLVRRLGLRKRLSLKQRLAAGLIHRADELKWEADAGPR